MSLATVTKELVDKKILKNSNKTVKALVACCLADIIRLHAPTCPYNGEELKVQNKFIFCKKRVAY
jgi:sister-chromatid-cohesion protein PDS5